ncbi:MAG: hypothetical protein U1E38_01670 [Rhodospirillales bacterium]
MSGGSGGFSRPCDPDDIYCAIIGLQRRGVISGAHLAVLGHFGLLGRAPDARCAEEAVAAQRWAEALDRLAIVLRAKGIVGVKRGGLAGRKPCIGGARGAGAGNAGSEAGSEAGTALVVFADDCSLRRLLAPAAPRLPSLLRCRTQWCRVGYLRSPIELQLIFFRRRCDRGGSRALRPRHGLQVVETRDRGAAAPPAGAGPLYTCVEAVKRVPASRHAG